MKKEKRVDRALARLFALFLVLLGFSACSSGEDPLDMYGTPVAEFNIKGKVVDSENPEKGLPGIQVLVRSRKTDYNRADTLYTDAEGEFIHQKDWGDWEPRIICIDKVNEEYRKDSVEVEYKKVKDGKGPWNEGIYEAEALVKMKKQVKEDHE